METMEIVDMFDFESSDTAISRGDNGYWFYVRENDIIRGCRSSDEESDIIMRDSDDRSLADCFYDYYTGETIMYRNNDFSGTSVYKFNNDSPELIAEYDTKDYRDSYVSYDGDICFLISSQDKYNIEILDKNGEKKHEYEPGISEDKEIADIAMDADDNVYLLVNDFPPYLVGFDSSGSEILRKPQDDIISVYSMFIDEADAVNIYANTYDGNRIVTYDGNERTHKSLNEYMTFNYLELCLPCTQNDLFFKDDSGIYSYEPDNGIVRKIYDMDGQVLNC
jgi:hypothetical protein